MDTKKKNKTTEPNSELKWKNSEKEMSHQI